MSRASLRARAWITCFALAESATNQLMSHEGGLRREDRAHASSPVQIVWTDRSGVDRFIKGRSLDISVSGMSVEVSEQIERQTYVTFQCPDLDLHGTASVRSCSRKAMKYIVGLEFSGGLKWKQPKPES